MRQRDRIGQSTFLTTVPNQDSEMTNSSIATHAVAGKDDA
jgi:hypothetical protein